MVQKINFNNITGNPAWTRLGANTVLQVSQKYLVDVTNGNTVLTLPSAPRVGDEIRVIDYQGAANTTNVIILDRNGQLVEQELANVVIDIARAGFGLVYSGAAHGWVLIEV